MAELGDGAGSSFPSAVDTNSKLEFDKDSSEKTLVRADVVNDLAAAVVAMETELGVNPSGTDSTVAARLAFLNSTAIPFTSGDTTPSVSAGALFSVPAAVTITNFDDPPAAGTKLIEIISSTTGVIIVYDATKIKLSGQIDAVLNSDDSIVLRYDGSKWVERYRILL